MPVIEVGKYYKTRSGLKAGPMTRRFDGVVRCPVLKYCVWQCSGKLNTLSESLLDLVEEWTEPLECKVGGHYQYKNLKNKLSFTVLFLTERKMFVRYDDGQEASRDIPDIRDRHQFRELEPDVTLEKFIVVYKLTNSHKIRSFYTEQAMKDDYIARRNHRRTRIEGILSIVKYSWTNTPYPAWTTWDETEKYKEQGLI